MMNPENLNQERWESLCRRDKNIGENFVYAVVTTGVYCRPTCSARRPRFENVRFFATNEEAERAGFRACNRCKPNGEQHEDRNAQVIAQAVRLISDAFGHVDLKKVASAAEMSRHHFHRTFVKVMGMSPGAYIRAVREQRVLESLSQGATVTEAIYDAGYGSSSRFYETAAPKLGLKPDAFKRGGGGETIAFALGETSLGTILVAATPKGICSIKFGNDPEILMRELQDRFPDAELSGGDQDFEGLVAQVVALVEMPYKTTTLPLDIRGTAFQQQVWNVLRDILPGQTLSYSEVAARLGKPNAVRAVATACAANQLAVVIPCHRVVRNDGSLAGYRWGVDRKAALLAKEAVGFKAQRDNAESR